MSARDRDMVREYAQFRSFAVARQKSDSQLRDWRAMPLRERERILQEYQRVMGGGDILKDLVLGTSQRAMQALWAETLSHISAALSTLVPSASAAESTTLTDVERGIQVCV